MPDDWSVDASQGSQAYSGSQQPLGRLPKLFRR